MSSLTEKLKNLGVQVGTSHIQPPSSTMGSSLSLVDVLPGAWESNPQGECFVVRKKIPLSTSHGYIKLKGPPDMVFFESLSNLEGISDIPPEDFLFIDTETTGLSGGAGSYVFLVGAAKYEKEFLNFAQFFLQDPGSESAQLTAFENFASSSKIIVSYNGKSFDLPRIKTRYRYHGWPDPFEDIYHLDLLHFARRLWKTHLPSCTLGDLEANLLGLQRSNLDIPGWKVSEHFYEYLNTQDPSPLENIFYHNEVDVITLAALLGYITERLTSPLRKKFIDQVDLVSIGIYLFTLRQYGKAKKVLSAALSNPELPIETKLSAKITLAAIFKKNGDFPLAAELWNECASMGSVESFVELAKYAEHRLSDIDNAIHWTLSALDSIDSLPPDKQFRLSRQLEHRLRRLKVKANR
jgi:uncharacterized protein YprB with RNaseH-like and TPR domain